MPSLCLKVCLKLFCRPRQCISILEINYMHTKYFFLPREQRVLPSEC